MSSEQVLPTKIYLIELKNKLSLMRFAKRILERKRDSIRETLKGFLISLGDILRFLKKELSYLLEDLLSTATMFENSLDAYTTGSLEKILVKINYIPKGGILLPKLDPYKIPNIKDRFPEGLRAIIRRFLDNFRTIIKISELLASLEFLLRESEITNRIVNTLDKFAIPDLENKINYINMMLSEFMISELSSLRVVIGSMEE